MSKKTQFLNSAASVERDERLHDLKRELLRPSDIQAIYGIPISTQAKGRMTGEIYPFVKFGRSVFAFRGDVEAWLRSKLRRSTSDPGTQAVS